MALIHTLRHDEDDGDDDDDGGGDDDDDDDEDDDDDGKGDGWQHVCSSVTLFHAAQRAEDQIAQAGLLIIIRGKLL